MVATSPYADVQYARRKQNNLNTFDALIDFTHTGHVAARMKILAGICKSLSLSEQDDPLLLAYQYRDNMKAIARHVIDITKWCDAVIEATPDQIDEKGAQPCH